ncbi:MAG: hypothetical protein U0236_11800 [Nitrospira sp.]
MPIYNNRVHMEETIELRRYTTLDALVHMLRNRQLRLTRVDKFSDPFEGSIPKKQFDDQVPIFSGRNIAQMMGVAAHYSEMTLPPRRNLDPWTEMKLRRCAKTRSAHASCWTAGHESEAMWRLYCRDERVEGQGVALQSTLGRVEASVSLHDLFVSPIRYRHYHDGDAFTDELDPFMHKRMGFAYEGEVRLLKYDETRYLKLAAAFTSSDPNTGTALELPEHIFLDWSLSESIQTITISPYADEAYEKKVREEIRLVDSSLLERVELSVLSERRYAPNF